MWLRVLGAALLLSLVSMSTGCCRHRCCTPCYTPCCNTCCSPGASFHAPGNLAPVTAHFRPMPVGPVGN